MLNGTALDAAGMGQLLRLLAARPGIFSVNLGEMPGRPEDSFWLPYVLAIERGENGVAFGWADAENGNVTMVYKNRLIVALRENRRRLESLAGVPATGDAAPTDLSLAPWRSRAVKNDLFAQADAPYAAMGQGFCSAVDWRDW
mmetsp:Transcript_26068/g.84392  ORF Transcript_26068/g.84392 Transcript_26068/m.84392 type:complete len:143 (+) Transcript_26068:616-1044(+)